ncbi:MAG: hypothetical protein ACJAR3_002836, partial [Roseivirga sp.]
TNISTIYLEKESQNLGGLTVNEFQDANKYPVR